MKAFPIKVPGEIAERETGKHRPARVQAFSDFMVALAARLQRRGIAE
ncbi:hypothetical protein [Gloeobacter morelensis]|uniref:Uncharacterized protein n=1 Tax=Gloeobacter morelensis MG652769 TaxID=2781736 RepID=A0ABY3PM36_9CYAN|nr:hypothetical protein [Gloeobacter morelensis]UFP94690.1 hypothetical protein ISF26_00060 [Gloeobacter morelensis MG652769]